MKNVLKNVVLGSVIAMLALTGCNGGQTKDSGQTTAQGNVSEETTQEKTDGEKVPLTYWSNQRHDMEYVQAKVDEFNETNDKNIVVTYEVMTENYDNNLELSFQSNQSPDIFRAKSEIAPYVNKDMILSIDEYLTEEDYQKYGETLGIQNINILDGKIYSLPQFGNTYRLIYNKDIFEMAGLDPEAPPKTMEEVREYAKIITEQLSKQGVYGFAMNLKNSYSAIYRSVDEVARLSDMFYYDFKKGEYNFNEYAKVVQSFADIYADGSFFPGVESLDIDPLRAQFALGNIGMYMSGYWEVGVYDSQFPTEAKWAASQLPTMTKDVPGVNGMNSAGRSFVLSSQTQHPDEAYEFVKFMTSDEYMIGYHEKGYGVIVVPSVAAKAKPATAYGAEYFVLSEKDTIAPLAPEMAGLVIEGKTFYDAFAAAIFGEADVNEAITQMNESYNAALKTAVDSGSFTPIAVE